MGSTFVGTAGLRQNASAVLLQGAVGDSSKGASKGSKGKPKRRSKARAVQVNRRQACKAAQMSCLLCMALTAPSTRPSSPSQSHIHLDLHDPWPSVGPQSLTWSPTHWQVDPSPEEALGFRGSQAAPETAVDEELFAQLRAEMGWDGSSDGKPWHWLDAMR